MDEMPLEEPAARRRVGAALIIGSPVLAAVACLIAAAVAGETFPAPPLPRWAGGVMAVAAAVATYGPAAGTLITARGAFRSRAAIAIPAAFAGLAVSGAWFVAALAIARP